MTRQIQLIETLTIFFINIFYFIKNNLCGICLLSPHYMHFYIKTWMICFVYLHLTFTFAWLTNNCSTHIYQYLKKCRESCNEIWSVNRIEYNMRNCFLEKSFTKYDRETIPWPFSKKSILSICLDQYSKVLHILFLLFAKFRTIKSDWN